MQRRNFMLGAMATTVTAVAALAGCSTTTKSGESAATDKSKRQSIDASVDGTISRLFSTVQGSQELVSKAQGILVFPSILQAGFIVGGQYGEGALRVGGHTSTHTVGYYSTASGSFGLTAGAQSKAMIILFMTAESLADFRNSKGWTVAGDASVALVKVGANGAIDNRSISAPVEIIVMTNSGLMADVSLAGTKVTPLNI
jgi:lipid-binding SYLF domain-containing protein